MFAFKSASFILFDCIIFCNLPSGKLQKMTLNKNKLFEIL